jgi:Family of unknown function (DUF6807)
MTRTSLMGVLLVVGALGIPARAAETGFSFQERPGELDVLLDGRNLARYMHAYDKSSAKKLLDTYKPYLHVFDPAGKAPITKGPGGLYTHHRGIFIGWNKMGFEGKTYDRWHMKGGEQVHQKFLEKKAGPTEASFTSLVYWNDQQGKPFVEERRTITLHKATAPFYAVIDVTSTLVAPRGDVVLDGDPEHAGVQFRPANEVARKETVYVFPKEKADPRKDRDYPWVGETVTLKGNKYSVIELNHPDNPKGTIFSAYRDYGRFGGFFKGKISKDKPLTVKYRFLVAASPMPEVSTIQKAWDSYAGAAQASPTPKTTVKRAAAK